MLRRYQFSLRTLLASTVIAAVPLAVVMAILHERRAARPALIIAALGLFALLPCLWVASFRWRRKPGMLREGPNLWVLAFLGACLGTMLPFAVLWLITGAFKP